MADTLSPSQITSLAKEYTQFGATINDFLNNNDVADDDLYKGLSKAAEKCASIGMNLSIADAKTQFADSAEAFRQLLAITTDANKEADSLKIEVAQISRALKIAAGMLGLVTALGSGNPSNVTKALGDLHDAIWGS